VAPRMLEEFVKDFFAIIVDWYLRIPYKPVKRDSDFARSASEKP